MPKEYTAVTKLSDEYKEVDLAIGMSMVQAQIKSAMGSSNSGMNDMEVYYKALKTEDFARSIAHKQVAGKGMTYGEYLGVEDTLETVSDHIAYNYSNRQATLTIGFTDGDAQVATQMLDSVTAHLQQLVTDYRHSMAATALSNVKRELDRAEVQYRKAQKAYNDFAEANSRPSTQQVKEQMGILENDAKLAHDNCKELAEQYVRQQALTQRALLSFTVIQNNSRPLQENRSYILYFAVIASILLLTTKGLLSYREKRGHLWPEDLGNFFAPWTLSVFIWAADIMLYYLQGTMDPIRPKFVLCLAIWLSILVPTSLVSYCLSKQTSVKPTDYYQRPLTFHSQLFDVLCVVAGLLTMVYAARIWGIVSRFDIENLLYNLRLYIVEDNSVTGLLNHVQGLNFALFIVGIWVYPKISKWHMTYIVLVNLVFQLFRMEKSGILIMILGTMFLLYVRRKVKLRSIFLTFAGVIVFFFFFNLSKEEADTTTETTFLDFFGMYVTSPMVAFDFLQPDLSGNFGENTFCIIYPYLNMLGFNLEYMQRLQEFVWVPIPTNVYTIMQPFYNDFGIAGIAYFALFYGVLFGWCYRRFREGNPTFICIYTYMVEIILIQFYNDNLLQNIVLFMEFWFCTYILLQQRIKFSLTRHA